MRQLVPQLVLASAVLLWASPARAQQPDPRDYEIGYFVPSKTLLTNVYLRHVSSSTGSSVTQTQGTVRGTYILKKGDLVVTPFDLIVPAVDVTAHVPLSEDSPVSGTLHTSGLADLLFLPTIGYGVTQDAKTATHSYFALTTYITLPLGSYEPDRLVNIGRNRFAVQPLLMFGQRFAKAFTFEVMGNVSIYGANDEFRVPTIPGQDLTLEQDLSFGGSAHLAADLSKAFWLGGSYILNSTGATETDIPQVGVTEIDPATTVHTARLNLGHRLGPTTTLLAQFNYDVAGSDEATLARFVGLRLSHAVVPTPKKKKGGQKGGQKGAQ